MVEVCFWERKLDWGVGGGSGAGDLGNLGRLVFLRGSWLQCGLAGDRKNKWG